MGLSVSTEQDIQYTIQKQSNANKLYGINSVYIGDYIAAATENYTYTNGTPTTVSIPDWCTNISVILIGGGGGGGYGQSGGGGGGGGGAALASKAISVSPGTSPGTTTCSITVGAGGAGGSNQDAATAGGYTRLTLNNPSITLAAGGGTRGANGGNGGNGGDGGVVSGSLDYMNYIQKSVNGTDGSSRLLINIGGTGGGRTTLNGDDVPVYCADFIASGGVGGSGNGSNPTTGFGGGGGGGGNTKSGGNGANGYARIYFYL
jgi:hypothetical protein